MSCQKKCFALGSISVLLLLTAADNSVHILSKYGQLVTSSTLNWLPQAHYEPSKEIVIGGFEIVQETEEEDNDNDNNNHQNNSGNDNQAEKAIPRKPLFVCRALHNGVWVAGSQKTGEKRCTVSLHGNVRSYEKYDLLENVDSAARVSWQQWDKYVPPSVGAVAIEKMYLARHKVDYNDDADNANHSARRYTHYIGTIYSNDNFGTIFYVKNDGVEETAKSGEVLVETEPISYKLTGVKLQWPKRRVIKRTPRVLGEATISNTGQEAANMAEAFGYSYKYMMYWGQGHAMLKGLKTCITLYNGTTLPHTIWGTEEKKNRTELQTVEVFLEPGTAVNVTLKANYTDMEVPYTGELVSYYNDSVTKARVIKGNRREETLFDIEPEFGPVYFSSNYSLVPTTTPPPTTTELSTTKFSYDNKESRQTTVSDPDQDENMIVPRKKETRVDTSNIQSDDGGPLSLKNKVEGADSGTCLLRLNVMIVPFLAIMVYRIT